MSLNGLEKMFGLSTVLYKTEDPLKPVHPSLVTLEIR